MLYSALTIMSSHYIITLTITSSLHHQVRKQHLDCDIHFLTKELKVTDEPTARNRVFFVSAKEVIAETFCVCNG